MIKNLVFDFGNVLVDYDFDLFLSGFIPEAEARKRFAEIVCDPVLVDRFDKGDSSFNTIVAELQTTYPEWHKELETFRNRQLEAITGEVAGMRALLKQLKQQGYRLYGLSNWSNTIYPIMEKFGIFDLLDGRIISSEEHLIKPDAAIYHRLYERFALRPDECLFTDDKAVNIQAAIATGMHAIHFQNALRFANDFESYLQTLA